MFLKIESDGMKVLCVSFVVVASLIIVSKQDDEDDASLRTTEPSVRKQRGLQCGVGVS